MLPCAAVNAFKPHLAAVADYPYAKLDARVKLDQNESPEDFPPELKARAVERIAKLSWNRYPELHAEDVRAAIARHEGWPEEGVVVSPGSNLLVLALAEAAASVIDTAPAFPYYKGAAVASATPFNWDMPVPLSICANFCGNIAVTSGLLGAGTAAEYAFAKKFFGRLRKPIRLVAGNHDYIYEDETDKEGRTKGAGQVSLNPFSVGVARSGYEPQQKQGIVLTESQRVLVPFKLKRQKA